MRIGKAICLNLAEKGYDIALHYNSSKKDALETKKQIEQYGVGCELFKYDLSSPSAEKLVIQVLEKFPKLCVLVNNASVFEDVGFFDVTPEFLETDLTINFKAPFFLSQSFAKNIESGVIVNFLDMRIRKIPSQHFCYNLSKQCLYHLTKMLAKELAPNFRINAVCPGTILAPPGKDKKYVEKMAKKTPMKRTGSLENITNAVNYLLENDYVTGECLFVDGGISLT